MEPSLTAMSPRECRDRLAGHSVGRVAITSRALPAVVPVTYVVDGSTIHFRTQMGGMLARACDNTVVAFETDELPPDRAGWSVLVIGRAKLPFGNQTTSTACQSHTIGIGWDQLVTIEITHISGWRHGVASAYL